MSKMLRKIVIALSLVFVLMNVVAAVHAYKFTHFSNNAIKTKKPEQLSIADKMKTLLTGVNNPRPVNRTVPKCKFDTITLQSNKKIACWYMATDTVAKGTVLLYHGYSGEKSGMLDKAYEFQKLGYNTILVDFMGSGQSEGNQTTVGYLEAEEVKTTFDYIKDKGAQNIYLFGTSMGAAAILKSIHENALSPKGIMIECPFGSLYQTICARFNVMGIPSFPMASLLVLWGGIENGFWGAGYKPATYAASVKCSTLLMYGERDKNVSRSEINDIYHNLNGPKKLKLFHDAGHENYLGKYHDEWVTTVADFLRNN